MGIGYELLHQSFEVHLSDLGLNVLTVILLIFFAILIAITVTDIKTMIIPPAYNIAIFILGIISIFAIGQIGIISRIAGALCVSVPMFLVVLAVPGGFGGGDIKLMAAAGFLLGFRTTLISFFIGLILGGIFGVIVLVLRKKGRKDHFAFGPFLCAGMVIAMFVGNQFIDWYLSLARGMYIGM